jgi:hypothetical protein
VPTLTTNVWRRLAIALGVVFVVVNAANALNKGGDAAVFFEGGRRFLHVEPLYAASSAADGFIGPPFQALFFVPFAILAALSPAAVKLLWYGLNVVCLGVGIWLTLRTWTNLRTRLGVAGGPWLPSLFAPLGAVLMPLQTNFEHQNMNALLLALLSGATFELWAGSSIAAGVLLGIATALKAFPALLIVYLVWRRHWLTSVTAAATALVLTVVPAVFVYGVSGFRDLWSDWSRLGRSGWPIRGNNQSLVAALDRFTGGLDQGGVRTWSDAPAASVGFAVIAIVLVAISLWAMRRNRDGEITLPIEMTAVTVLAVLLTPIAWDHYWTMLLPAFVMLYYARDVSADGGGAMRAWFWTAAILTTGLSPLTLGRDGFDLARRFSATTIAGVILLGGLLWIRGRLISAGRTPSSTAQSHQSRRAR